MTASTLQLALVLFAVVFPFLIERYYFQVRGGMFQVLFWIFAAQCVALAAGAATVATFGAETVMGGIGQALGGFGFIAIGAVPYVFLPIVVAVKAVRLGWSWIKACRP